MVSRSLHPLPYPPNPEYGTGAFRRRIIVNCIGAEATISLIDSFHEMWCRISHDGSHIIGVQGRMTRYPMTTCPTAAGMLDTLAGLPISLSRREFYGDGRTGAHCTHFLDMVFLALAAIDLGRQTFDLEALVTDERCGQSVVVATVDATVIHRWEIVGGLITRPDALGGRSLFGGFAAWAEEAFVGIELHAARALQKSLFVARGRRYIVDATPGHRALEEPHRLGDCYTFSEPQIRLAETMTAYSRDFSISIPRAND